ncbi:MAG: transketolase [Deltaproteobacteria bacterium]|nr:MAG: transketolase [Deltaproteobacteria bacterium]
MTTSSELTQLAKLVRYHILTSTTAAGSGHPTSSMSAADVMTTLFFKYLKFDTQNPQNPNNDRVIFSKGHAAPLLYSLYTAAGTISPEENLTLRKMGSPLQGHPMPTFKFSEAATGSLGQGLSIGVGMALNAKYLDKLNSRVFTLLGDGEMAEGSVWEAIEIAAHYKLNNLIGIIDVNRLGQSQQTMFGHDVEAFVWRVSAFGWKTVLIDGHSQEEIEKAFDAILKDDGDTRPRMIVAKTNKGHGISFLSDKEGWHGKALSKSDLEKALAELGPVDVKKTGTIAKPENLSPQKDSVKEISPPAYKLGESVATRKAYGNALARLADKYPDLVAVDGDTKNSTFTEILAQKKPERFFEMFIAEQNMIGVAAGLGLRGKIPFAATFAAFLTRTYDQLRMAAVSQANFKVAGSHVGVSIGEDGASQMGLEDIAMFRALHGSTVFYPSDAMSTEYLVEESIKTKGIVYLRTSRPATPVLYDANEKFPAGGSKVLKSSAQDRVTLVGAGVTLHESLKAYELLQKGGISVRVIDLYSVKPIDEKTLKQAAQEPKALIVVEDHWFEGGLGDAVLNVFASGHSTPIVKMAVTQMPSSASPEELIEWAGISAKAIVAKVKSLLN